MGDLNYIMSVGMRYGAALMVATYCLYSFLVDRKRKPLIYFFIYILFFVLSSLVEQEDILKNNFNVTDIDLWLKITHSFTTISLIFLLNSILDVFKSHKRTLIISILFVIASILNIIFSNAYIPIVYEMARYATYAIGIIYFPIAWKREKKGLYDGHYLVVAMIGEVVFIVLEVFKNNYSKIDNYRQDSGFLVLYLIMTITIWIIYSSLLKSIFAKDES